MVIVIQDTQPRWNICLNSWTIFSSILPGIHRHSILDKRASPLTHFLTYSSVIVTQGCLHLELDVSLLPIHALPCPFASPTHFSLPSLIHRSLTQTPICGGDLTDAFFLPDTYPAPVSDNIIRTLALQRDSGKPGYGSFTGCEGEEIVCIGYRRRRWKIECGQGQGQRTI